MKLSRADAEFMVNALLSRQYIERLSEWEDGFARSIRQQLAAARALTAKQEERLEAIFDRITDVLAAVAE